MYVCMYVCMYIYIYIYTHTHICMHTQIVMIFIDVVLLNVRNELSDDPQRCVVNAIQHTRNQCRSMIINSWSIIDL
jgi:hypothetical protein